MAEHTDIDPGLNRGDRVYNKATLKEYAVTAVVPDSDGRLKAYKLREVSAWPVKDKDYVAAIYLCREYQPKPALAAAS